MVAKLLLVPDHAPPYTPEQLHVTDTATAITTATATTTTTTTTTTNTTSGALQ